MSEDTVYAIVETLTIVMGILGVGMLGTMLVIIAKEKSNRKD